MTFVIPLRFHEGRDESKALIPVSSLLRNVENVDALFLGWTEQKNAPSEDDVLVPYSLLKHTILLEPYICFLFTLRSSPTVSEVGLPLPFVTTLDRRDEEGLFAGNIRLPDITNCLCVFLLTNTLVMYCVQLYIQFSKFFRRLSYKYFGTHRHAEVHEVNEGGSTPRSLRASALRHSN